MQEFETKMTRIMLLCLALWKSLSAGILGLTYIAFRSLLVKCAISDLNKVERYKGTFITEIFLTVSDPDRYQLKKQNVTYLSKRGNRKSYELTLHNAYLSHKRLLQSI